MTFGDLIRTAAGNLGRRKVRTALTTFGVIVGITTIVAMLSLAVGVQRQIRQQFEAVGLENIMVGPEIVTEGENIAPFTRPQRVKPITPADVERWRQMDGVESITPGYSIAFSIQTFVRVGDDERPVIVPPAELVAEPFTTPPTAIVGKLKPEAPGEIVAARDALPSSVRDDASLRTLLGQQIEVVLRTPRGEEQAFPLTLAGVTTEESAAIYIPLETQAAIKSWWFNIPNIAEVEGYDYVFVRAEDINDARVLADTFNSEGYEAESLEMILQLASQVFTVINVMLGSVGGLALFVATLGIVNTMIMAIYERTREIGTLKAIGASRSEIRWLFMVEAGMIGMIGGLVGLFFGWLIGLGLNRLALWYLAQEQVPFTGSLFVIPSWLSLLALGFAVLVGIIAGLYPAHRAARLDPIAALRHD